MCKLAAPEDHPVCYKSYFTAKYTSNLYFESCRKIKHIEVEMYGESNEYQMLTLLPLLSLVSELEEIRGGWAMLLAGHTK